ncbi:hypothetical protein TWF217_008357 [Orbilia oligospora]|nr:hypothetical protein TWF217_008357 [Orbilia oligospora]
MRTVTRSITEHGTPRLLPAVIFNHTKPPQLAKKLVPDGGFCSKFEYISTELARRAQIPKLRFVILKWVAEFGTHPLIISWQAQVA